MTRRPRHDAPATPLLEALEQALTHVAVTAMDAERRVVFWSSGAEALLGHRRDDVIGAPYEDVIGASLELAGDAQEVANLPGRLVDHRGQRVEVNRTLRLSRDDHGEMVAAIELLEPAGDGGDGPGNQAQLLQYARDIARSRASEREKERELDVTMAKLERVFAELKQANLALDRQRRELSKQVVLQGTELADAHARLAELAPPRDEVARFHGLVSGDPRMLEVFRTVTQVARTTATVLVLGESGTGKELIARAVHQESQRREGPFVAVNCAALTPTLAESQLFGHIKGAFTGAIASHDGVFRQADGGTLFLDEVAELPLEMQSKLLRAVQESTFTPLGSTVPVRVDVRLIAATHRDLAEEVRQGRFREDLMYRLQVVPLVLPPLRERRGDIEVLLRHLLARFNASPEAARQITSIAPAVVRQLLRHRWSGNVRELENVIQHAYAVGMGSCLTVNDLPAELRAAGETSRRSASASAPSAPAARDDVEDEETQIREALARTGGRINEAAELLGVSRATFFRKRKKYDL